MNMEILKRELKLKKETINLEEMKFQISYNNFGHLVLRFFNPEDEKKDTLIVFTAEQTRQIYNFIKNKIQGIW